MALPNLSQISEALDKIMPELTPVPVGTVAAVMIRSSLMAICVL